MAYLKDAYARYRDAAAKADLLPLTAPVKMRGKATGVVAGLLRADERFSNAFSDVGGLLTYPERAEKKDAEPVDMTAQSR